MMLIVIITLVLLTSVLKAPMFHGTQTKYYVKRAVYCMYLFLMSIPVLLLSLFTPRHVDNIRYYYPSASLLRKLLGLEFEVKNRNYIPDNQPCLLVSNHQTELELLGMAFADLKNTTFLAKRNLLLMYGPFGWAAWLCGGLFIDRQNHASALQTLDECSKIINTKKIKLWVFPEGYLCKEKNSFLPFKKGAFHLAVNSKIPIVPVVFSSYHKFYNEHDAGQKRFDEGKVTMTCLPPVSTAGLTSEDVPALTETVRSQMFDVFRQTSDF